MHNEYIERLVRLKIKPHYAVRLAIAISSYTDEEHLKKFIKMLEDEEYVAEV
jgi:hypothetical protein